MSVVSGSGTRQNVGGADLSTRREGHFEHAVSIFDALGPPSLRFVENLVEAISGVFSFPVSYLLGHLSHLSNNESIHHFFVWEYNADHGRRDLCELSEFWNYRSLGISAVRDGVLSFHSGTLPRASGILRSASSIHWPSPDD